MVQRRPAPKTLLISKYTTNKHFMATNTNTITEAPVSLIKLVYPEKYGWLETKDNVVSKEDYEQVQGIKIEVGKPFTIGTVTAKFIRVGESI